MTGSSSGIGYEAALSLYKEGHHLILPCRDHDTSKYLLNRLSNDSGREKKDSFAIAPILDLADLDSVRSFADNLLSKEQRIDSLILNAGLQYTGAKLSRRSMQDYELTIAVNHLAHQYLAQLVLPLLDLGTTPRVVVTSSEVHNPLSPGGRFGLPAGIGSLNGLKLGRGFEMLDGHSPFSADKAYKDSKLCNILFARELNRRLALRNTPMPVIAWAPGLVIPKSSKGFFRYSREYNEIGQRLFSLIVRDVLKVTESPFNAGHLLKQISVDSDYAKDGFSYLSNHLIRPGRMLFSECKISEEANNDSLAMNLWTLSSSLLGISSELTN